MLVTVGKFVRSYLYQRLIGGRNVRRVMKAGVQIWPSDEDRIRRITFEMPAETQEDWAYWQHVEAGLDMGLDARRGETKRELTGYSEKKSIPRFLYEKSYKAEGWVVVRRKNAIYYEIGKPIYEDVYYEPEGCRWARCSFDGVTWYWKKDLVEQNDFRTAVATWNGRGTLDFGDYGPYRGTVNVGDEVPVEVLMPEREDEICYEGDKTYDIPLIRGTRFYCKYHKGGDRVPTGMYLTVKGLPSGSVFVDAFGNLAGHWTGNFDCWTPPGGLGNHGTNRCTYNDKWTPGDTQYTATVKRHLSGNQRATPHYPAFKRTIKLKVVDIVYND